MFNSFSDFWAWGGGIFRSAAIALAVCAAFWVVSSLLYRRVGPALTARIDENKRPLLRHMLIGFHRPVSAFLKLAGICVALLILSAQQGSEHLPISVTRLLAALPPVAYRALRVAAVVAVAWGLVTSSDAGVMLLHRARNRLDIHMSQSVSRFLAAVFNVVVVAMALIIILAEFDVNINGLVAGLGLGGLTVALAAKDSAGNFFGGLVLITEKPFEIGDWIVCQDVEGTVEDINLRSTKVRTIAGSLTIVPNSVLAAAPITNWGGGMEKRRADFTLNLEYGTDKRRLHSFCAEVKTMLETDPEIDTGSIVVRFSELSPSSLDVRVIFYTSMPGFADHLRVRERVNYALLDLAAGTGVKYAFPSRTVHLAAAPGQGEECKP